MSHLLPWHGAEDWQHAAMGDACPTLNALLCGVQANLAYREQVDRLHAQNKRRLLRRVGDVYRNIQERPRSVT